MGGGKKSQISLFLIISLIMLFIAAFFLILLPDEEDSTNDHIIQVSDSVITYVENCLQDSSKSSIKLLGLQGGYIIKPQYFDENLGITYLYHSGQSFLLPIEKIQEELSYSVSQALGKCVDFNIFKGVNITNSTPTVSSIITQDSISFFVDWKIEIKDKKNVKELHKFNTKVYFNFFKFYDITNNLVQNTINNPAFVDNVFLLSQNMDIKYTELDESVIYFIKNVKQDELDYKFVFATEKINGVNE